MVMVGVQEWKNSMKSFYSYRQVITYSLGLRRLSPKGHKSTIALHFPAGLHAVFILDMMKNYVLLNCELWTDSIGSCTSYYLRGTESVLTINRLTCTINIFLTRKLENYILPMNIRHGIYIAEWHPCYGMTSRCLGNSICRSIYFGYLHIKMGM